MIKVKSLFLSVKQKVKVLVAFSLYFLTTSAYAEYDIGAPDSGPFARITSFFQDIINLIDGPIALGFSFVSLAGLAATWAFAPQLLKAMGTATRIIIAVIIILNIGAWITALNS